MPGRRIDRSVLAQLNVLRGVSLESVEGLLEECPVVQLSAGDRLLTKGERSTSMHLIVSGRLAVYLDRLEGEPLSVLESGDSVGELSVLDEQPVGTNVVALETSELLEIDQPTLWSLAAVSHVFTVNLLLALAMRLRTGNSAAIATSRLRDHFEHAALFDALTGLRNRRWLDQTLPRLVARAARGGRPMSLLVADVDHFKDFNDSFGHAAGDLVLGAVAQVLMECLRPTDMVARFGGEEFVVVLMDTGAEGARIAAERLRARVGQRTVRTHDGNDLPPVTISFGLAQLDPADAAAELFRKADAALYRAKQGGRNRVEE